jgi:predicted nucleic acid-binding protein
MIVLRPSSIIAVDSNILLSAILGQRTRSAIDRVSSQRELIVSREGVMEVTTVLMRLDLKARAWEAMVQDQLSLLQIVEPDIYSHLQDSAASALRNAPASRNGSDRDAHLLALAWLYDADIWSHDRDFAGTGWPSWSSANLAATLTAPAGA